MTAPPDDTVLAPPGLSAGRFRLGGRAMALDAVCGTLAMAAAYLVRFGPGEAVHFLAAGWPMLLAVVGLQVGVGGAAGLYRQHGQVMWPLRLALGAVGGAVAGIALAAWSGADLGFSRQAVAGQVALIGLGAVLWRAVAGLEDRQEQARVIADRFGGQALVVQGDEVGSMAGSIVRTWRYRHLLTNLVAKDLKLKYQRSLLGFAWSLLNPLIMIGVYTVAFTYVMRLPTMRFALFILIGLLAWNFFAGSVTSATEAVSGQGSLLRSVVFPRVVLPFSAVLFNLTQYLLTIVVFLPVVLLVYGVPAAPRMLLFPLFLFFQVLFTAGLALILSTAAAAFRDVRHLVEVGIGIGFWATPIIYEPTMVPEQFRQVALLSPMASFIRAYQDIFYYGVTPEVAVWVVAAVYGAGTFVCGLSVFLAYEGQMPEMA
ncbi:MAG TPA: ABC transporter permease [Vicinamibacterales bacterium]|nr:ABC transporter permease [Vicinamibacterales bacterium]